MDPTTQSNYDQVATEHVDFDWRLDFQNRVVQGSATHQVIIKAENVHEVMSVSFIIHVKNNRFYHSSDLLDLTQMI
jgi:leukotriene-A4 hydrolase